MNLQRRFRVENFETFRKAVDAHHGWGHKISVVPDRTGAEKGQIATYGSSSFGISEPRYVFTKASNELEVTAPDPMSGQHTRLSYFWSVIEEGARAAGGGLIQR